MKGTNPNGALESVQDAVGDVCRGRLSQKKDGGVRRGRGLNFFPPLKRYQFLNNTYYFRPSTLNGSVKASAVDILRLRTPEVVPKPLLPLKGTASTPVLSMWESSPSRGYMSIFCPQFLVPQPSPPFCSHHLLRRRSLGSSRNLPSPWGGRLRDEPKERLRRRLVRPPMKQSFLR